MTTTYDPGHPAYLEEADLRGELSRVFDICHSCRQCVDVCATFPTLFELLDRTAGGRSGGVSAGDLTPQQQDDVAGTCVFCRRCSAGCPYVPGAHEWAVDVPRLMLRTSAVRHATGVMPARTRRAARTIPRTELVGRWASALAPIANRLVGARPGSLPRRLVRALTGVTATRALPRYAARRFSAWFAARPGVTLARRHRRVVVFPTCLVEYHVPELGRDLVKVYERNGVECAVSDIGCCGVPWLHAGDVRRFKQVAERNVARLAAEVRRGADVVVPQPSCCYALRHDYPDHVDGPDAALVAGHTFDASDFLLRLHEAGDTRLDTAFDGPVPERIVYHVACHLRAEGTALRSRDLLKLTGARVAVVEHCAGLDGHWSLRSDHDGVATDVGAALAAAIPPADAVAGDCHLANTVIAGQTGREARHPLQIVARAYGLTED